MELLRLVSTPLRLHALYLRQESSAKMRGTVQKVTFGIALPHMRSAVKRHDKLCRTSGLRCISWSPSGWSDGPDPVRSRPRACRPSNPGGCGGHGRPPGRIAGSSMTLPGVVGALGAVLGRLLCRGLAAFSWALRSPSWIRMLCKLVPNHHPCTTHHCLSPSVRDDLNHCGIMSNVHGQGGAVACCDMDVFTNSYLEAHLLACLQISISCKYCQVTAGGGGGGGMIAWQG